jgi:putative component of membrane protein insertase Oxa1/YidC/SpoIIIJ protein YidD
MFVALDLLKHHTAMFVALDLLKHHTAMGVWIILFEERIFRCTEFKRSGWWPLLNDAISFA